MKREFRCFKYDDKPNPFWFRGRAFRARFCAGAALLALAVSPVWAGESSLDWPCQQREVAEISLGQNWPYPYDETAQSFEADDETQRLIALLSLRRTTPEEARTAIEAFAATHPDLTTNDYGWIYAQVLAHYNARRAQLIEGIKRYADGQQARAAEIDALAQEIKDATNAEEPDFDKIDEMEVNLDWDTRIYNDREDALSYVCESPILIEKQAYAMAQALAPFAAQD